MNALLGPDDLVTLTGTADKARQVAWLAERGIPHRAERVGNRLRVIVAQYHVHEWLEGRRATPTRRPNLAGVT